MSREPRQTSTEPRIYRSLRELKCFPQSHTAVDIDKVLERHNETNVLLRQLGVKGIKTHEWTPVGMLAHTDYLAYLGEKAIHAQYNDKLYESYPDRREALRLTTPDTPTQDTRPRAPTRVSRPLPFQRRPTVPIPNVNQPVNISMPNARNSPSQLVVCWHLSVDKENKCELCGTKICDKQGCVMTTIHGKMAFCDFHSNHIQVCRHQPRKTDARDCYKCAHHICTWLYCQEITALPNTFYCVEHENGCTHLHQTNMNKCLACGHHICGRADCTKIAVRRSHCLDHQPPVELNVPLYEPLNAFEETG